MLHLFSLYRLNDPVLNSLMPTLIFAMFRSVRVSRLLLVGSTRCRTASKDTGRLQRLNKSTFVEPVLSQLKRICVARPSAAAVRAYPSAPQGVMASVDPHLQGRCGPSVILRR